jgi:drug/metabolite transporter superfamily protein YnfA
MLPTAGSTSLRRSCGCGWVEGEPPTKTDMFGAGLAIIGALVIIGLAPRTR